MHADARDELIQRLVEEKRQGKEYSEIRNTLKSYDLEPEEVSQIIRLVDDQFLRSLNKNKDIRKAWELMITGGLMTVAGLIILLLTLVGILSFGLFYWNFISLLGGPGMMMLGYRKYKRFKQYGDTRKRLRFSEK